MSKAVLKEVPIKDVVAKAGTWNPVRDAAEDEIAYIDLSAVDNVKKAIIGFQTIAGRDAPSRARQLVQVGDILVSTVRPNLNGVAKVPDELEGATASTGFCVLRPRPGKIDSSFLFHWVQSPKFVDDMVRKATGASYPAVSDKIIFQSAIPLPSLNDQKRIAAILDQADELRRKRQHSVDLLNQLGQAIFHEMFGDPASNARGLPVKPLGELCRIRRGGSPRPIEKYLGGNIPWIKIGDATKGDPFYLWHTKEKIIEDGVSKSTFVEEGSLIFANCGVSLGFARITKIAGCIHDGWLVFDQFDPRIDKLFLVSQINMLTERLRNIAPNGTQPNLNTKIMGRFEMLLPSISQQHKYITVMDQVRTDMRSASKHLQTISDLTQALQHRAFEGEL